MSTKYTAFTREQIEAALPDGGQPVVPGTDQTPVTSGLAAALALTSKKRTPTAEQAAIIDAARSGVKVLVVQAGAGTGKTSTDVMLAESLGGRGQYTAFNAPLVAEAKTKMPAHVAVNTIHSLAFRAEGHKYAARLGRGRVKSEEVAKMLGLEALEFAGKRLAPGFLAGQVMGAVRRFCNSADVEVGEQHFSRVEGLDMPGPDGQRTHANNSALRAALVPFARRAWEDIRNPYGRLPFSHDCYAKIWQLNYPVISADYLLVDEAQDLVPRDLAIITAQKCQVILVGDDAQTIYAWRGCVNAMSAFPDAPRLLLSQSFRFGPAIAAVANAVLETLEEPTALRLKGLKTIQSRVIAQETKYERSASTAVDGLGPVSGPELQRAAMGRVDERNATGGRTSQTNPVNGTGGGLATILCRTNAAAVAALLTGMRECKRPFLVGGGADVVKFVEGALAIKEGRGTSHPELACFSTWAEVEEYAKADEGEDLRLMVKLIKEFGCRAILDALRRMPDESQADFVISTAHKAKGREWDRVRLAADFPPLSKCGDAEKKLVYVAVTRAKLVLDVSGCPFFTGQDALDVSHIAKERTNEREQGEYRHVPVSVPASVPPQAAERGGVPAGQVVSPQAGFTWAKLRDGSWGVRGPKGRAGQVVTVVRKAGTRSQERLGEAVWENADVALYRVKTKE
jgi:hypothetical protein